MHSTSHVKLKKIVRTLGMSDDSSLSDVLQHDSYEV